jgi:hypothetical protein
MIDLLESRIDNAERTMRNQMAPQCTATVPRRAVRRSVALASSFPTPVLRVLSAASTRATWTFWQSKKFGSVADGGGAATTANIISYMNRLWLQLVRGTDKPDIVLADNNYYRLYMEALQPQQRFTSSDMAQAGFESLKFQSADVVFDGGIGGACPANHMFFLNTDYVYLRPHSKRQYVPLSPDRFSTNQDAMVKLIGWAGNMTLSGAMFQGALIA